MPVDANYLWKHGRACLQWAQECFDLSTATRLRRMGEDFVAKAAELDAECRLSVGAPPIATAAACAAAPDEKSALLLPSNGLCAGS